jgi:hypothetical protein
MGDISLPAMKGRSSSFATQFRENSARLKLLVLVPPLTEPMWFQFHKLPNFELSRHVSTHIAWDAGVAIFNI